MEFPLQIFLRSEKVFCFPDKRVQWRPYEIFCWRAWHFCPNVRGFDWLVLDAWSQISLWASKCKFKITLIMFLYYYYYSFSFNITECSFLKLDAFSWTFEDDSSPIACHVWFYIMQNDDIIGLQSACSII